MQCKITHDSVGVCVTVTYEKWSLTLRMTGDGLRKSATSGGFIPTIHFKSMVAYGRKEYEAHHCPDCPTTTPSKDDHPTHFRKEVGSVSNPRHWADRDLDD